MCWTVLRNSCFENFRRAFMKISTTGCNCTKLLGNSGLNFDKNYAVLGFYQGNFRNNFYLQQNQISRTKAAVQWWYNIQKLFRFLKFPWRKICDCVHGQFLLTLLKNRHRYSFQTDFQNIKDGLFRQNTRLIASEKNYSFLIFLRTHCSILYNLTLIGLLSH